MRATLVAAVGLSLASAVPSTAAVGTPGPFAGAVRAGEVRSHAFSNNPTNAGCPAVMAYYTVSLAYAPATDRLTLTAAGVSVTGSNGRASISLYRSYCTSFGISVSGTSVGVAAGYGVNVTRSLLGGTR